MKLISSRVYVCLMLFFAILCGAQNAMADNTLSVQPFSLDGTTAVNVPVALDNSDAITQLQFDVVLPTGLYLAGNPVKNNERLTQHQLTYQQSSVYNDDNEYVGNRYRILIVSLQSAPIEGNSGTIVTLPIRSNSTIEQGNTQITLENIVMTDAEAQTITQPAFNVEVSMLNCEFYTDAEQFVVIPGKTQALKLNLKNNFPVYGAEFDIAVPEGFTIDTHNYEFSDRVDQSLAAPVFNYIEKDGVYRFILTGLTTDALVKTGEGDFLTLQVTAPESYTGETPANIVVKNSTLSYVYRYYVSYDQYNGEWFSQIYGAYPPVFNIALVNANIALDKANNVVKDLEESLADALETIETECPDVKDDFKGEEITAAIEDLKNAIQTAYDNGTLTPNYDEVMAPAEGISNDIDALVSDAQAAQAAYVEANRKAANEAAYNAVIEALDELQAEIDETKADIAKEYPGVDVSSYINKAQEELDAIRKAADEAYEAVETEGMFKFEYDPEPIETALADAKDQASRLSTAEGAYAEAVSQLDALQEQLNITKTVVAVQYPGVDVTAKTKAAQAAIDDARKAAKDALEAAQTEGAFEYEVPVDEITAAINAIPAEAKRLVDNEAAYKADVKTIDQLEKKLDAAYDQVVVDFPEVSLDELKPAYDAAKDAVDAARAAANEAYAAVISEGDYDYEVPVDEIEALIKEIRIAAENAGLNDITVDALPEDFRMFNLQGVEVENPAPGSVVIIRNNKGVSRKVLVM